MNTFIDLGEALEHVNSHDLRFLGRNKPTAIWVIVARESLYLTRVYVSGAQQAQQRYDHFQFAISNLQLKYK